MRRSNLHPRTFLDAHPRLRGYFSKLKFDFWKKRIILVSLLHHGDLDPSRTLWIDPRKITNVSVGLGKRKKLREFGKIVGGTWDRNTMPFADLDVFKSFTARFVHGIKWEDTSYYESILDELALGINPWGLRDKYDLNKRLDALDTLFEQIQKYGYKTQQQLLGTDSSLRCLDEVTVHIGRSGEFLFSDGRHRLAIAKILQLPRIPVMVAWRHRDWFLFREEILDFIKGNYKGKAYQPLTHPDLSDIPSMNDDRQFKIIKSNLDVEGGTLLNIGAHWGYFCHKFEEEGFHCYAVEKDFHNYYFLNKLKIAENRGFTTAHADITEIFEKSHYDVVLALNVLHQFTKTAKSHGKLVKFLRRLKTIVMFFTPHQLSEAQMQGAYRNYSTQNFVTFLADNTGLTKYECIGYGNEGRPIYKLTGTDLSK
jgi:2-polyprenyl-3-methyl-5-hydroxy-6-metoxy-1,4-benzoquinol methylase